MMECDLWLFYIKPKAPWERKADVKSLRTIWFRLYLTLWGRETLQRRWRNRGIYRPGGQKGCSVKQTPIRFCNRRPVECMWLCNDGVGGTTETTLKMLVSIPVSTGNVPGNHRPGFQGWCIDASIKLRPFLTLHFLLSLCMCAYGSCPRNMFSFWVNSK